MQCSTPGCYSGGFFLPLFSLYVEIQHNARRKVTDRHTPPLLSPCPGTTHAPSPCLPPGTAHGSPKKTSWMPACSPPLRRGTGPSKPPLLPQKQGGGFSPAWTSGASSCLITYTHLSPSFLQGTRDGALRPQKARTQTQNLPPQGRMAWSSGGQQC